jgi:hypothetical protein
MVLEAEKKPMAMMKQAIGLSCRGESYRDHAGWIVAADWFLTG